MRIPSELAEAAAGALGQWVGVQRELDEEDVEEDVEDEDSEGKVGTELKGLSSSSTSTMDGSPGGTGVHGCQLGATEQDLTRGGRRSSPCVRHADEAL